ncbi:hypothetical protein DsansV1_C14g0128371 [Dioscorea sansibarensis]
MGRRKERRLAAMHGAGRRVKLDLFAEPSGEAGGSSSNDGVGRNMDHNHHAGDPVSPSSSGGFHEYLFKGLYRENMPAKHIFGGNFENIAQDFVVCMKNWF